MLSPVLLLGFVLAFIILEYLLERFLDFLNSKNWSSEIPAEMTGYLDADKYKKSQLYDQTKKRIGLIISTFSLMLISTLLLTGGFGALDGWVRQITEIPVLMALIYFGVLFIIYDLISLPFAIYDTFVIEAKFGFNKTTLGTFVLDKIKGVVLTTFIGGGLLALMITIYEATGQWFWLIAWVVITLFSLFITVFYTSILVPIFNKLTPLEPGELRNAINQYVRKVGFPLKNIMVMDSSKRSSKSNAYFSGLGAKKTIVLFDTLIQNHTTDELVAILAHEVGHYKKKHIRNGLILSTLQTGILLFIFGQFVDSRLLAEMLGAEKASFHIGMIGFTLLFNPISLILGILFNLYSRKNEFEADAFAKETFEAQPMVEALKKLSVHNLSNLRPHPAYVFFHYSHPPVLERISRLKQAETI